ncbi:IS66 family transposase [Micromonospora sp. LOL_023]|uniref:IS66 family transposase n=1 Tax=Micromonospora sp. LOL_023 TaxID=3345418 RepID=UPI003A8502FF
MRVDGHLAWLHSASTPTDVLLTVHRRRGTAAMDDAGVLPAFTGVAVHDAWAPYDTYTDAVHALRNAHELRELVYVVDTATGQVADLAGQAIDALRQLNRLTVTARADGSQPDPADLAEQTHLLRSAVVFGAEATADRTDKLHRKRHALFVRLRDDAPTTSASSPTRPCRSTTTRPSGPSARRNSGSSSPAACAP